MKKIWKILQPRSAAPDARLSCFHCRFIGVAVSIFALASTGSGQVFEAWVARLNGGAEYADDHAAALAVDANGNVYVAGHVGNDTVDFATIKYDPNGNQLWVRYYNGPGNGSDRARALQIDSAGNVVVTGYSHVGGSQPDYTTIKYNAQGTQLWVRHYDGPGQYEDYANALAIDAAGNIYVTGNSSAWSNTWQNFYHDYATIKYNSSGTQIWVRRYNGSADVIDRAQAIALDAAGNVIVTGSSRVGPPYFDAIATIKYDAGGGILWTRLYEGSFDDAGASDIAVDSASNIYVTGRAGGDYATIKYGHSGTELWARSYDGPFGGSSGAIAIAVGASGSAWVTGSVQISGYNSDYATVKYDTNGAQLWDRLYDGPANYSDVARALALDTAGNAYVTGYSWGVGGEDYATIKYDSTGNQSWFARYNGPANSEDRAAALAVDGVGNIYVTGGSVGVGTQSDYATIKYIQGIEIVPSSYSMFRGSVVSGDLASLQASDNNKLVMRLGVVLSSGEPPIQIILNATAPNPSPSGFSFSLESNSSIGNAEQNISLYNYVTGQYEVLDTRLATTSDSKVNVSVKSNTSRYIQPFTMAIRARVSYRALGPTLLYPWLGRIDKVWWSFPG